jgi:Tol biopolymer transport system component
MQLYIMDKDGNNIRKITNISNLTGRADWGPNGQMASFSGVYEKHNRELFLFSENGSIEFITSGGDNLAPSFSPDGNWIAFTSYRDDLGNPDGCEIYILRLGDGLIKRVTQNDYCDYQPRWGR